ncbi:MAG TPA: hypothetical protein VI564_07375 [Candidatus Nanoarchaeia archaeon]|nr:hypothetical protein [Candidatus Nanoarchaeia archaeon]
MKIHKKSQFNAVVDIVRLMVVVCMFLSVVLLSRTFIIRNIDIFDLEADLAAYRILFSDKISYVDPDTGRIYAATVDLQKFQSSELDKNLLDSIFYGKINSESSAKMTLYESDSDKKYEAYYNKELYYEKKVLVEAKLSGKGSAQKLRHYYYVLIKDGEKLKGGTLEIETILPNR